MVEAFKSLRNYGALTSKTPLLLLVPTKVMMMLMCKFGMATTPYVFPGFNMIDFDGVSERTQKAKADKKRNNNAISYGVATSGFE